MGTIEQTARGLRSLWYLVFCSFFLALAGSSSFAADSANEDWRLPLDTGNRKNFLSLKIDEKAKFMADRIEHLHTGIDLENPIGGTGEKVYAASLGKVVSIYAREPNLAVMIEHRLPFEERIWTVYVHLTDIQVLVGDRVTPVTVIGYLMNDEQLSRFGRFYNHLHFEILRTPRIREDGKYLSYSIKCRTPEEVMKYFYDPSLFFQKMLK